MYIGHDEISEDLINVFNENNISWKIYLSQNQYQRPRYVPGFAQLKHMHTGVSGSVIVHEAGHYMGLDDDPG